MPLNLDDLWDRYLELAPQPDVPYNSHDKIGPTVLYTQPGNPDRVAAFTAFEVALGSQEEVTIETVVAPLAMRYAVAIRTTNAARESRDQALESQMRNHGIPPRPYDYEGERTWDLKHAEDAAQLLGHPDVAPWEARAEEAALIEWQLGSVLIAIAPEGYEPACGWRR